MLAIATQSRKRFALNLGEPVWNWGLKMKEWTTEDRALRARLEAFDLDEAGASLPFNARLARDNGWSPPFAARVVAEYKRFVFLAMRAGHPVTPSDEVDQAWHQHLCYTRSYWDALCGEVLGAPLHHGPTRGGQSEGQKFADWYARTLQSYREWFGEEPPRDIWPPSEIRFGQATQFRRLNTRSFWMVKKPAWAGGNRSQIGTPQIGTPQPRLVPLHLSRFRLPQIGLPRRDWLRIVPLLFALILAGCAGVESDLHHAGANVFNWHGASFLLFFWTLSALGIAYGFWRKNAELRPLDAVFPTEPLDAFHVARLRDAKHGAVDVALAILHQKGALEVTPSGTLRATFRPVALSNFERAVLAQFETSPLESGENSVRVVRQLLQSEAARLDQKLRDLGLLVSRETEKSADNWPLGITFGLLLLGAIKIAVGVSRDRPVGFLVMSCAVIVGFGCYFLTHPARRSRRGDLYLAQLNRQKTDSWAASDDDFDAMALHFALFGPATYPPEVQRAMRPPSSGSDGGSGCSYSSGDSGGDGGGGDGGGGCGGCGGGGD